MMINANGYSAQGPQAVEEEGVLWEARGLCPVWKGQLPVSSSHWLP